MTSRGMFVGLVAATLSIALFGAVQQSGAADPDPETARITRGYQISPVALNLRGKDRNLVGLGSYIVNAQGGCNDCHTEPQYAAGGDPFQGQPEKINTARYLAGGRVFGPFISANITPNDDGLPAGLTYPQFRSLLRTGHEPGEEGLLQVMPWPVYRNMTDRDLKAVYAYLTAIPHREGGEN